jgi:hypothetical protein
LYLELRVPEPVRSDALPLIDKNWVLGEGIQITAAGEISITPNPKNGTEAALTLTGLEPRARYAWIFTADSPVRMADLEASVQPGLTGKSSAAWIDYDGVPQRLVLSGKTSSDGKLTLRLNAPAQPWEAADTILIRNQELRKIAVGGK